MSCQSSILKILQARLPLVGLFSICTSAYLPSHRRNHKARRHDTRTCSQCYAHAQAAWQSQISALVAQYLAWKHKCDAEIVHQPGDHLFHVSTIGVFSKSARSLLTHDLPLPDFEAQTSVVQKVGDTVNIALIHHGLLGCSPTQPSCAISLYCLELYHQIRRRQSSFSVQAMVRVLCALHNVHMFVTRTRMIDQCL